VGGIDVTPNRNLRKVKKKRTG